MERFRKRLEEDEKSLLSSLLGNQEEESFLDSLLAAGKGELELQDVRFHAG